MPTSNDTLVRAAPISPMWNGFNPFLMGGLHSPLQLPGLELWLDTNDLSSLVVDGSNRTNLASDKSGNSSTNVLCLNGVAGNYVSAPDSAALSITADYTLDAEIAADTYRPSGQQELIAKYSSAGNQRGYMLQLNTTGTISIWYSVDGTAGFAMTSSATLPDTNFAKVWVRGTLDVNDGSGNHVAKFYTSPDGVTWTQLGSTITTAGAVSVFDNTAVLAVGARSDGAELFTGKIYRARIYNGYDGAGTLVFDANFATAAKLATSFTESSSNAATVTINTSGATGARISGARDLYQGMAASQQVYLPWSGTNYGYLNGVSGNYFSTPDSAASSPTTQIEIVARINLRDYSTGSSQAIMCKYSGVDTFLSYTFRLSSTGVPYLTISSSGSVASNFDVSSGSALPYGDNVPCWIKVTWLGSSGAGNFYHAVDSDTEPTSWTLLSSVTAGAGSSIFDSTSVTEIGSRNSGTIDRLNGFVLYAAMRKTIGGADSILFSPGTYSSSNTFTASTGEVWTINGGATIVTRSTLYFDGSNNYLKAAAFSLAQPETVYFVGSQVTWTIGDYIYGSNATATDVRLRLFQFNTTPRLSNDTSGLGTNSGLALATNGIVSAIFDGASSSTRVNRAAAIASSSTTGAAGGFTLGSAADGTAPANITASEVLVFSGAHDTVTQDRIILYLARKWKIAA